MDETLLASNMRATTPLAAIMKSSMSSVARFFSCFTTSTTLSLSTTGLTSMVSMLSAPCRYRSFLSACATSSCSFSCDCSSVRQPLYPGLRLYPQAKLPRHYKQAALYCGRSHGKHVLNRRTHPCQPRTRSQWLSLSSASSSEVMSVESCSGSMGKFRTPVYTVVVSFAACASMAEFFGTKVSTSAIAHQYLRFAFGNRSATSTWSRSREVSLSIEDHSRLRRSRMVRIGAIVADALSILPVAAELAVRIPAQSRSPALFV